MLPENIELSKIRRDGGTQPRSTISQDIIEDYSMQMVEGAVFPPVTVFYDGEEYWLADGFHRVHAADAASFKTIAAEVHQGTRRDAVLFSVGANAAHGWRRSNEDKRRAVKTLLNDPEWSGWSDREIARRCHVDHVTVSRLRPAPPPPPHTGELHQYQTRTFTHPKTGAQSQMNVSRIGSNPAPRPPIDRAVFDATPSGARKAYVPPAPAPAPTLRPEPSPPVPMRDPMAATIFAAIDEIRRQMDRLPTPSEAAARCDYGLAVGFGVDDAAAIAKWWEEFSALWIDRKPVLDARISRMVENTKGMGYGHAD